MTQILETAFLDWGNGLLEIAEYIELSFSFAVAYKPPYNNISFFDYFRFKNFWILSIAALLECVRKGRRGFQKVKWLAKVTHLIHVSFCLLIRGQVIYRLYYSEAPCYNGISTGFEVRDTWVWHKDLQFVSHAIGPVSSNFLIWEMEIIMSAF